MTNIIKEKIRDICAIHRETDGWLLDEDRFAKIFALIDKQKKELLEKKDKEIRQYAQDWAEKMWDMGVFNTDGWEGVEEIHASIVSYLEGNHLPLK